MTYTPPVAFPLRGWPNVHPFPADDFMVRPGRYARTLYNPEERHMGHDFTCRDGDRDVLALGRGPVLANRDYGDLGYVVWQYLEAFNIVVVYAHLTRFSHTTKPGRRVEHGAKIARSGNTGDSSGPHLHIAGFPGNTIPKWGTRPFVNLRPLLRIAYDRVKNPKDGG